MKLNLLFIIFTFISTLGFTQITITNATFPQPGDTLITATDNLPDNISVGDPGPNQTWDFSSLEAPFLRTSVLRSAATGTNSSAFLGANIVTTLGLGDNDPGESYYLSSNTKYEFLGYIGMDPAGLGVELLVKFQPTITERRAPLNYGDTNTDQTEASVPFSADELPSQILDSLPIRPDSLRLRMIINRNDEVDAWGTMMIPGEGQGESFEVLREKRVEIREIRLDVKVSILPWQDITSILPPDLPLFGKDTITSYYFFSNDAKEPIAVVAMNELGDGTSRVEFKADRFTSSVRDIRKGRPNVFAYPNPAITDVRFEFTGVAPSNYSLKIYNILGVEVWRQDYFLDGAKTVKADISNLKKGTYLYSLVNENGETIATKRLMVIRP